MKKATDQTQLNERIIQGVPVSDGVAVGQLYFFKYEKKKFPRFTITVHEVDKEIQRYRTAIKSSKVDLQKLENSLKKEGHDEAITIINTHIQMLDDPFITTEMEERIRNMLVNTETVFNGAIADYEKQFSSIDDQFFKQRLTDVKDLSRRILDHLNPAQTKSIYSQFPDDIIIFSKELTPSHTAEAKLNQVKAFITEIGGKTSHAGLIARAKGIPFVADIDADIFEKLACSEIVVDGNNGIVIIYPTEETKRKYMQKMEEDNQRYQIMKDEIHLPSKTKDGISVSIHANVENSEDIPKLRDLHVNSIGLLRSEFIFVQEDICELTEEQQIKKYRKIFANAKDLSVYFRVFDVGGDKNLTKEIEEEINPALGCRSIRYLLKNPRVLRTQLRALLQSTNESNIKILIPLISDLFEIISFKEILKEVKEELGITYYIPVGAMIEVPSSAIMVDVLAKHCDFLSIGTNDLIQYTLAVDRVNPNVADIYRGCHPSVVRLLKHVYDQSAHLNIPFHICGEMASNPLYTPLLIGIGYKSLSCSLSYIPIIKHTIRKISMNHAKELVEEILSCSSYKQTYEVLEEYHKRYFE